MSQCLLKNGTTITFEPVQIAQVDLRIADGQITEMARVLEPRPGEHSLDLSGKIVLPGLVCAHTHLYSALARGMPAPPRAPANFPEILEYVWWPLDRALDEEALYSSAVIGILEALAAGTTTIIDHHASPGFLRGSLRVIKDAFESLGARGVLCYEVTDRNGLEQRDLGIEENRWILEHPSDLVKGMVGAHAAFTLSDESLRRCANLMREHDSGLHIHLAEDACDPRQARAQYDKGVVQRLADLGGLNAKSLVAHGVHLQPHEVRRLADIGCWLAHNPRSNMNNGVGYFPLRDARPLLPKCALGTDGIGANMFEEAKFAFFKAQDAGKPIGAETCVQLLAGGHRLASEIFQRPIGALQAGAVADLIVLDYAAPTPLNAGNFPWHLIFGITHAHVESVMVNGRWLMQARQFLHADLHALYQHAQTAAQALWQRLQRQQQR
jgi:putative selenium metabolism protein SsnA